MSWPAAGHAYLQYVALRPYFGCRVLTVAAWVARAVVVEGQGCYRPICIGKCAFPGWPVFTCKGDANHPKYHEG